MTFTHRLLADVDGGTVAITHEHDQRGRDTVTWAVHGPDERRDEGCFAFAHDSSPHTVQAVIRHLVNRYQRDGYNPTRLEGASR